MQSTASPTTRTGTSNTPPERYPLLLHYPYFEPTQQVVKQADLVMALHLRGCVHPREKIANFAYYEP